MRKNHNSENHLVAPRDKDHMAGQVARGRERAVAHNKQCGENDNLMPDYSSWGQ